MCNFEAKSLFGLTIHLQAAHKNIKIFEYYDKYIDPTAKFCITCGNISKFISSLIGDSVTAKLGKFFYNKSKVTKKVHRVSNAIKTKNYINTESSCILLDLYNKHIEVLVDFPSLEEKFEYYTQEYIQNKERYLREGWKWSESKVEDIKKSYQNSLFDYQNLINISNLYDIKLNFILDGVKECEFSCVFKER